MSTKADEFLSPRGLLINDKFCCGVASFSQIYKALQSVEKLPRDDQSLQYLGFTDTGLQAIQVASNDAGVGYRKVLDVCDRALDVGSTARQDYDVIFDGLEELYNDPDNESLHRQVDQMIRGRLSNMDILSSVAASTKELITSSTEAIIEHQKKLGPLAKPLQDSSHISKLLRERDHDDEDYQQDIDAVQIILKIMADQKMEDQSGPTLSDLEQLLGGVTAILSDITELRDKFESAARPGPDLVLNLRKENLIKHWDYLVKEGEYLQLPSLRVIHWSFADTWIAICTVKDFKDQYQT
ncbi:hypothetical protein F5X99DRAFT_414051 [Biscogniauxia marginata]|nr:hypothetical protein F5X99DRAFT_414051 [Biscogniauxia marginata]